MFDSKHVLQFLLSFEGREQIEQASKSTSGLHTLSFTKVSNLKVNIPSIKEQKEIVYKIEELFSFADKIEPRCNKAKAQLDKLPQGLLAKAFRGELVPQDENDEPASVYNGCEVHAQEFKTEFLQNHIVCLHLKYNAI